MNDEEEPLDSHVIELAETRPVMLGLPFLGFLGEVPMTAGIFLGMLAGLCFTYGGLKYSLWFFPAWWLLSKLIINNYHGLTHTQRYLETGNLFCLNRWRKSQGGVSVTPFPAYEKFKFKNKYRGMM